MARGRYMDAVRRSAPSPSSFLKSFADEKVEVKEPEKESFEDKYISDYENDPKGGLAGLAYIAFKKKQS
jgi:hypothetical protein